MSFCDGVVDIPLVIELVDSPEHCQTHNHVSAKHLVEVGGAMTELLSDVMIDRMFIEANKWTDPINPLEEWDATIICRTRELDYYFVIVNPRTEQRYEGPVRTVRDLQHILRDLHLFDTATNLQLASTL